MEDLPPGPLGIQAAIDFTTVEVWTKDGLTTFYVLVAMRLNTRRVEIAGVHSQNLNVKVDGQILRIAGIRLAPEGLQVRRLHQMEIASGPFERRLRIPIPFDRNAVSAQIVDGFLTVTLPKREAGPKRIAVKT